MLLAQQQQQQALLQARHSIHASIALSKCMRGRSMATPLATHQEQARKIEADKQLHAATQVIVHTQWVRCSPCE